MLGVYLSTSLPYYLQMGTLTFRAGWLASKPQKSVCSSMLELQAHTVTLGFYVGAGDSNSGHHAGTVGSLTHWAIFPRPNYSDFRDRVYVSWSRTKWVIY